MTFAKIPASFLPVAASVVALAGALFVQYGLGWKPCELCLLQRIPILTAGLVAVGSLAPGQHRTVRDGMIRLAAIIFLGTALLAAFHVGVEQHWWLYGGGCSVEKGSVSGNFALALSQPVVVRCDQSPWIWHGITLAGLNVVYSAAVGGLTLLLLRANKGHG